MADHSQTPWFHTRNSLNETNTHAHVSSTADEAGDIATCWLDDAKANAAFIVKAVNSHDALVKALEKVRSYNVDIAAERINYRPHDHIQIIDEALATIKETV